MTFNSHLQVVVDNSKANSPFLTEQHEIFGGKALVVRTKQSGDVYQLRMWVEAEHKYYRQSLHTKHLDTAIHKGVLPRFHGRF